MAAKVVRAVRRNLHCRSPVNHQAGGRVTSVEDVIPQHQRCSEPVEAAGVAARPRRPKLYKQQQCYQTRIGRPLALLAQPPLLLTSAGPNPLGKLVGLPIISHCIPRIMDFVSLPATHCSASLVVSAAHRSLVCSPDLMTLRNTNIR